MADSNITKAVDTYSRRGAVKHGKTRNEAIEALVEAYSMDVAANGNDTTRLAFAHRRKDVHALNQAIRQALKQNDSDETISLEVFLKTETGKRAFATGDRIVFSRNDKELGVKNGILGTVRKVSEDTMTVVLDGDTPRELTFNPNQYQAFDHGYAVTTHKSQGATVDQSYVLASRSMDRHLAYVAMTRHRDDMRLYINEKDKPNWAQREQDNNWELKRDSRDRIGPSMG